MRRSAGHRRASFSPRSSCLKSSSRSRCLKSLSHQQKSRDKCYNRLCHKLTQLPPRRPTVDCASVTCGSALSPRRWISRTQLSPAAGVTKTFSDTMSGARDDRPGLAALLDYVREGDTVVVWKLDRLGRNTLHILETVKALTDRGVTLISTTDGIDSSTAAGRMMIGVLGSLAEYERELVKERTALKRAMSLANGTKFGRRKKVADAESHRHGQADEGRRAYCARHRQVPRCQPRHPLPILGRRSRITPGGGT